jgi:hypothetical protein
MIPFKPRLGRPGSIVRMQHNRPDADRTNTRGIHQRSPDRTIVLAPGFWVRSGQKVAQIGRRNERTTNEAEWGISRLRAFPIPNSISRSIATRLTWSRPASGQAPTRTSFAIMR